MSQSACRLTVDSRAACILFTTLCLVSVLSGCLGGAPDAEVLATFYPLEFLTKEIAGDNVTVGRMIPEGTEPHDWEPSPRDLQRIDRATLVVAQGLEFEPWLEEAIHSLGEGAPRVVRTAEGLDEDHAPWEGHDHDDEDEPANGNETLVACLIGKLEDPAGLPSCRSLDPKAAAEQPDDHGHEHAEGDPHTWLDPVLFAQQAERIRDALADTFPEHRDSFFARSDALVHELEELHEAYEARLDGCRHNVIVVPHDAFSHLAERYDFEVEAVAGLDPEAEPAARRVQEIIDLVREKGIPVVFSESGGDDRIMRSIAQETGAELRPIHTLEGRSKSARDAGQDYLDLMRENLDGLAAAMECNG